MIEGKFTVFFSELKRCLLLKENQYKEGYITMFSLFTNLIEELVLEHKIKVLGLPAQLIALRQIYTFKRSKLEQFYVRCKAYIFDHLPIDANYYEEDLQTLNDFVNQLKKNTHVETLEEPVFFEEQEVWRKEELRFFVSEWKDKVVNGFLEDQEREEVYTLYLNQKYNITPLLYTGAVLNLIDVQLRGNVVEKVKYIVLEPDYLLDISLLAATFQPFGTNPMNYFLKRFHTICATKHTLLGNIVNQFMDDCIYHSKQPKDWLYKVSLQKSFQLAPLSFLSCGDDINEYFFKDAYRHFSFIYDFVEKSPKLKDESVLEPSFICPTLGIRGRLDVLAQDYSYLIEVKSGKAKEIHKQIYPKETHAIQALLYRELLKYNRGEKNIRAFLYYTKYPMLVEDSVEICGIDLEDILQVRNRIIDLERRLKDGEFESFFNQLSWEVLNENKLENNFVENYLRPPLEKQLAVFKEIDDIERAYFTAYVSFILREQFYAKIGGVIKGNNRGFAQVWLTSIQEKIISGDVLTDLRLVGIKGEEAIEELVFNYVNLSQSIPNFRIGELIGLRIGNDEKDTIQNQQITRAYLTFLSLTEVRVSLLYKQSNKSFFDTKHRYVIEHESSDASFTQMLRNLYTFLEASKERKALLLGLTMPVVKTLERKVEGYDLELNTIVHKVEQAKDYFLIVGPPGTGKTSRVIRALVESFLKDKTKEKENILLVAYTNRAVDELCEMLETITEAKTYVRLGTLYSCEERFKKSHISEQWKNYTDRKKVMEQLQHSRVWVSTLSTLNNQYDLFKLKTFSLAIFDEASQILEPQLVGLLSVKNTIGKSIIEKFVLVGDHYQLPAVVTQPIQYSQVDNKLLNLLGVTNLSMSFFERLYNQLQKKLSLKEFEGVTHWLTFQGRMHQDICAFPSKAFYSDKLQVVSTIKRLKKPLTYLNTPTDEISKFVSKTRFGFISVEDLNADVNPKINVKEAMVVKDIIKALIDLHSINKLPFHLKQVGVIVPFRNQIACIKKVLQGISRIDVEAITIDTVECYQGSQRDFIIFSTTISRLYQLNTLSDPFCSIDRKLNVALTRAKEQMFVVGNAPLLSRIPIYKQLIAESEIMVYNLDCIS